MVESIELLRVLARHACCFLTVGFTMRCAADQERQEDRGLRAQDPCILGTGPGIGLESSSSCETRSIST